MKFDKITLYLIFFIFCWLNIANYIFNIEDLYNYLQNLNLNNFIKILFTVTFLLYFIFSFIYLIKNRKKSFYLFLLLYPLSGFLASLIDYENIRNIFFFFISTYSALIFFFHSISIDKKFKLEFIIQILKISLLFLLFFFMIFQLPFLIKNFINYSNLDLRNNDTKNIIINLSQFKIFEFVQNSDGASRVVMLLNIFLLSFLKNNSKSSKLFKITIFFLIFISGFFIYFWQSKFNIFCYYTFTIFFVLNTNLIKKYFKIIFITIIFLNPFIYNKISKFPDRFLNNAKSIKTNLVFSFNQNWNVQYMKNISKKKFENQEIYICKSIGNFFDTYTSGRVCGWEILIHYHESNDLLFGKGFLHDKIILTPYQKTTSNTYLNIFYNAGIFGLIGYIFFFFYFFKNYFVNFFLIKEKYFCFSYTSIIYIFFRSFFEDNLIYLGVDFLIILISILYIEKYSTNNSIN